MVLREDVPLNPILRQAPLLCIEILSKDDTMKAIMRRIHDYLQLGVPTCWIHDPSIGLPGSRTPRGFAK